MKILKSHSCLRAVLIAIFVSCSATAYAATFWTNWTSASIATSGYAASGTVSGMLVAYYGELDGSVINGTSNIWAPDSSFIGGTSTASPSTVGDDIRLDGSVSGTNTIYFETGVLDPVIAIWSLGSPSAPASFTFNATPALEAGGPNSIYGGQSITVSGDTVSGREGNGVVGFTGAFSSISWTDTFESFYAFTVGINGISGPARPLPEPSALALLATVLAGLGFSARRRP